MTAISPRHQVLPGEMIRCVLTVLRGQHAGLATLVGDRPLGV